MAFSAQVTVSTTPTLVVAAVNAETRQVLVHSTGNLYFGGDSSVSTSNGFLIDPTKSGNTRIQLHGGEALYAVTTSGTHTAYVLVTEI